MAKKVEIYKADLNHVKKAIKRGLNDGSPEGEDARKSYCAMLIGAFEGGLKDKIEYLVRLQQEALSDPMSVRERDLFHKGAINAFSLLLDWYGEIQSEFASYQNKKEVNINNVNDANQSGDIIINSMVKFFRYKQIARITLFGNDDLLLNDPNSIYKTQLRGGFHTDEVNTKLLRFKIDGNLQNLQLSNNCKLVLESVFMPNLYEKSRKSSGISFVSSY